MTSFVPIFVLPIVAFPTEKLNLHIFEPRYVQMINDCLATEKPFAIITVIGNRIKESGTLMQINAVSKTYDDGSMDIMTTGICASKILEIISTIPGKLYSGAIFHKVENDSSRSTSLQEKVVALLQNFHNKIGVVKNYSKPMDALTSFDIGHHVGFEIEQESELLSLASEQERLEFISQQLHIISLKTIDKESVIARIELNGEFRDLSMKDFDFGL